MTVVKIKIEESTTTVIRDILLFSDDPELNWIFTAGQWHCWLVNGDWIDLSSEANTINNPVPDTIANNTDPVFSYERIPSEDSFEFSEEMPTLIKIYDKYQWNPILWKELRQYCFVSHMTKYVCYHRTLRPQVGAAAIIPGITAFLLTALGIGATMSAGAGKVSDGT